jgi:hypothetical protein
MRFVKTALGVPEDRPLPPEDGFDDPGHVLAWVSRFACGDAQTLGPSI